MFGITILTHWLETHSVFKNIPRREVRIARRLQRIVTVLHGRSTAIDDAFATHKHKNIMVAFNKYGKSAQQMQALLMKEVVSAKIVLHRALEEVREVHEAELRSRTHDAQLRARIAKMQLDVGEAVATFFTELTSFESLNLQGARALGMASQLREAYFDFILSRKQDPKVRKHLSRIERDEVAGKEGPADVKLAEQTLQTLEEELHEQTHAIGIILLIMQELRRDYASRIEDLHAKVIPVAQRGEGYPEGWAESHIALLQSLIDGINTFIEKEIAQARIFRSQVEHAR